MPTGKSVRSSIHSALTNEARLQESWRSQADEIESRILLTKTRIGGHFHALSNAYIAEKDSTQVRDSLGPVLVEAERALEARRKLSESLNAELPVSQQALATLSQACESLQSQRDDLVGKVTALDAAARSTADFQTVLARKEAMQQTIEANKKRASSLKALAQKKLISYRANHVFRYLVERKYGLPAYSANPLASRLDRIAARSVNFATNFERYRALVGIPAHVDQDVASRENQLREFEAGPLADTEKSARESVGYFPVKEASDRAYEALQTKLTEREAVQNRLFGIQQKLATIVGGTDEHLVQALNLIGDFLKEVPEAQLHTIASGTPDQTDDDHVAQISSLRESLSRDINQAKDLSDKIKTASSRVGRLQQLEQDFRRRDYDRTHTNFPSLDINAILTGYLVGKISNDDFFSTVKHRYVDDTPVVTHHSSSWGSSSHGGFGGGLRRGNFPAVEVSVEAAGEVEDSSAETDFPPGSKSRPTIAPGARLRLHGTKPGSATKRLTATIKS